MSTRNRFTVFQDQSGTLYEIPILLFLFGVAAAVFLGNLEKLGFGKALLKTAIALGFIIGPFVALFLVLWGLGAAKDFISKKRSGN